jgi:hypothetical protein
VRDLSAAFAAALDGDILYPIFFYEIEGQSGTLRLWTGFGDRVWNGQTWAGVGWIIGMSEVEESTETRATSITIGMPANTELLSVALLELKRNKPCTVWMGLLSGDLVIGDPETDLVLGDPATGLMIGADKGILVDVQQVFAGLFDLAELDIDPGSPQIRLRYASKIADLERARVRRMTNADQQIDYPGDRFFEYVGPLTDKVLNWGG